MHVFNVKVGPNTAVLTCYVQDKSKEMKQNDIRKAMLVFPGGGYAMCSDREAEPVALAYLNAGYNAFVLRYYVWHSDDINAPQSNADVFPKAFEDAEAAFKYLKDNHEELGIDETKIAVVGFSAGGHLAASLGILSADKPAAMVLGYPVILKEDADMCLACHAPEIVSKIDKKTPPAFIFSTQGDELVPIQSSMSMASALMKKGIPCELHVYLTGGHGLSLANRITGNEDTDVATWFNHSLRFLDNLYSNNYPHKAKGTEEGYSIDTRLSDIAQSKEASAIIEKFYPGFIKSMDVNPIVKSFTLRILSGYLPPEIKKIIPEIDALLKKIPPKGE